MSIITYPLNGVTYDAEDVSTYLCTRTSGVYAKDSNYAVSVTGARQITVAPGLAWINYDDFKGVSACSREAVNLIVPDADSTLPRIDRVVLQFDTAANLTAVKLKPGTPSAAPEPPAILQNHNQYELGLCTVSVPAGSSVITAADITDTRADEDVCGVMRDGVTGIPTAQLQAQALSIMTQLSTELHTKLAALDASIASVESGSFYTKAEADRKFGTPYSLPPATADQLGGVKVGSGLTVDAGGRLSADSALAAYPVGSIFETVSYTSPASMFGGIWEEIAQGRTLMGATDAQISGTTVEAGLPNITGKLPSVKCMGNNDFFPISGAFSWTNTKSTSSFYYDGEDSQIHFYQAAFDASRSNAVYGASSTVQPPAYIVHIWERMGYLLNIRSNPGSSLTITNGETTVEDVVDDSGHYSRELPSTGTWIITASKDESVSTKTCAVNTYGVYTVDISLEVFGVVWNYGSSSTALTRLTRESDPYSFVSTNITSEPVPAVGESYGTSPFDKYMPWKGMEEYNIVNSVVGVKQGEQGFSRTNDTVVFIPEFYYKVVDDVTNQKRYFYISSKLTSGFEKHPGSGRYVGKYNTASGYVSKTGLAPLTNITRATARTESMAKGTGWYQYDYASWCAVVLLYIVEYADWNSSSKIGTGANKGVSGRTDSMTYHTGEASTTSGVQYRHIENVFGNIETFVDGINFSGNNVYVCTNPDKYADDTDSGYTYVGTKTGSNGYIKALGFSKTAPWAFYPTAVGGSNTTYITDQCWNTSSGWMTMKSQGTGDEGILYMSIDKNSNNSGVSISTRLMFVPSKH